jgi:hypothetical protein
VGSEPWVHVTVNLRRQLFAFGATVHCRRASDVCDGKVMKFLGSSLLVVCLFAVYFRSQCCFCHLQIIKSFSKNLLLPQILGLWSIIFLERTRGVHVYVYVCFYACHRMRPLALITVQDKISITLYRVN